jgi:hypothetical protein
MKAVTSSVLALALSTSMAMAADVSPLPAGHSAGIKNAQIASETAIIAIVGVAAAVGIALAVSGSNNAGTVVSNTNAVVATSTTS